MALVKLEAVHRILHATDDNQGRVIVEPGEKFDVEEAAAVTLVAEGSAKKTGRG